MKIVDILDSVAWKIYVMQCSAGSRKCADLNSRLDLLQQRAHEASCAAAAPPCACETDATTYANGRLRPSAHVSQGEREGGCLPA